MQDTLKELLASKRFLIITLTTLVLAVFVVSGKMPMSDFIPALTKLGMVLAGLYGAENVALAFKPLVPADAPVATAQPQTTLLPPPNAPTIPARIA